MRLPGGCLGEDVEARGGIVANIAASGGCGRAVFGCPCCTSVGKRASE